jgi:hypothetical protein
VIEIGPFVKDTFGVTWFRGAPIPVASSGNGQSPLSTVS